MIINITIDSNKQKQLEATSVEEESPDPINDSSRITHNAMTNEYQDMNGTQNRNDYTSLF